MYLYLYLIRGKSLNKTCVVVLCVYYVCERMHLVVVFASDVYISTRVVGSACLGVANVFKTVLHLLGHIFGRLFEGEKIRLNYFLKSDFIDFFNGFFP